MKTTPRLVRSFPFWLLLVGSLASLGYGLWLTIDKLGVMVSTLTDGSATGVEVYVGQSWAVFAAAFIGAGLIGLIVVLALVIVNSLIPRPVEVVEGIDWTEEEYSVDDEPELDQAPASETAEPENR